MRRLGLVALVLAGGCVYYNGMYNARRLANEAEKAERQGKRFEAQNYWAQAEIKADSVLRRHPNSSWADDALIIKAKSLSSRGRCQDAIPSLEQVIFASPDATLVDEANFLMGACFYDVGEPLAAERYLAVAASSSDSVLAVRARALYGSTLNRVGRYFEAGEVLAQFSGPEWDWERALAYAGSGYLGQALDLSDSLIIRRDTFVVWDTLLAVVARFDLEGASTLTQHLIEADTVGSREPARLRAEDARRWQASDPDRAARLFQAAAEDTFALPSVANGARVDWVRMELTRARTKQDLGAAARVLEPATRGGGGGTGLRARRLAATIGRVQSTIDSLDPTAPAADLEMFLLAETVRDSLGAQALAASGFERVAQEWPQSPYAPKAILALASLQPDRAEHYHEVLVQRYADSPYLLFIDGQPTPEFLALEDSLRVYAFARGGQQLPPPGARRRRGQPVDQLNPDEEDPE